MYRRRGPGILWCNRLRPSEPGACDHRDQHRCSCAYRSLPATALAHGQLLLPIEPEELLVVHKVSLAPEQHMKASIAKAAAFMRQRLHALAKALIVAAAGFVADCHAAKADGFTRPPFAHPMLVHQMRNSSPLCCGRHHFFPKRSFKAALSSMVSARSNGPELTSKWIISTGQGHPGWSCCVGLASIFDNYTSRMVLFEAGPNSMNRASREDGKSNFRGSLDLFCAILLSLHSSKPPE